MPEPILNIALRTERDVVQARQRARELAALLGFDNQDQIRLATATSEIARNAFRYARNGEVQFPGSSGTSAAAGNRGQRFRVRASPTWKISWKAATNRRPAWAWASSAPSG